MSFLFVDQIMTLESGSHITGLKTIREEEVYLSRDEKGRRVFPSALVGETLGQLAAWNVMQHCDFSLRPVAGVAAKATLFRPAFVGDTLLLEARIESLDERAVLYHATASVLGEPIVQIDGALGPLLPMNEFITIPLVKKQFAALVQKRQPLTSQEKSRSLVKTANDSSALFHFDNLRCLDETSMVAEKWIDPKASYLPDHFPLKPVLPMTVLLESKIFLAKAFVKTLAFVKHYRIVELCKIKMHVFVEPDSLLGCTVRLKHRTENAIILSFVSEVREKRVCTLEMVVQYE